MKVFGIKFWLRNMSFQMGWLTRKEVETHYGGDICSITRGVEDC